jgi:hypothetical protein
MYAYHVYMYTDHLIKRVVAIAAILRTMELVALRCCFTEVQYSLSYTIYCMLIAITGYCYMQTWTCALTRVMYYE